MPKRVTFIVLIFAAIALCSVLFSFGGALPVLLPAQKDSTTPNNQTQNSPVKSLPGLTLPSGFSISLFAQDLESPRDLIFDQNQTLLVSLPNEGKVIALPDKNKDGTADSEVTVISGLNRPHGLAFSDSYIYIAETDKVVRYSYNPIAFTATSPRKLFDLPAGGRHWSRSLLIHQGKLLTSVGSSCDVCRESDWRRAAILISELDGTGLKTFASGLRNSVFMTTHPQTGEVWATDMGRDMIGNNLPPDEVNIVKEGGNYGWPFCYGQSIRDTSFEKNQSPNPCGSTVSSRIDLQAHSAPLGLAFIPQTWPEEFRGKLLVAFHGSWNRNPPTGYKIVIVDPTINNPQSNDFITGWLRSDSSSSGRPVDVEFSQSGALFVSDDKTGNIYLVIP